MKSLKNKRSLDISFCSGSNCEKKESCARWTAHLERYHAPIGLFSIAHFADHNGQCEYYYPFTEMWEEVGE